MFVNEAGFYQLPAAVRTYAPRGQTPVLRAPLDYDNLSVISGITRAGKLYMRVFEQSISGEEVVGFLRHVLREVSGKLTIVWDGLPAHRGQTVKEFLGEGASRRLHLERLPGYAPDLNPDEGVWNYPQERRDEEPLLSRPRSPQNRTPESEGAASPRGRDHQELFPRGRISLNTFSRIGKRGPAKVP